MKDYILKVFYCEDEVISYCNDLNSVLDYISVILNAAVKLETVVNTKAFTFSISEVLR